VFLWPRSTREELDATSLKLFETQRGLYRAYRALMIGTGSEEDSRAQRLQEVQLLSQLGACLEAAVVDNYAVWEVRYQWRRFLDQSTALMETLEGWRESFPELQQLDLNKLLPNLDAVCSELAMRFEQIQRMLGGEAPERAPQPITLTVDKVELAALSHFERAALAVTKAQLDRLEAISRSLFDCVQDIQEIKGFGRQVSMPPREKAPSKGLALDPDRMAAVVSVLSAMWLAFLIWVYVDPPGHSGFVVMAPSLALALANAPQVRVLTLFLPLILSSVFAGVLYIFVMPHLSGFPELALMIFAATFAIAYLFYRPQQGLSRAFGLAFFAVITGVDNQQTYSFLSFANSLAMAALVLALLAVTAYIPFSPQPEKAFVRLLRRFFRHAEFLMSRLALDQDRRKVIVGRCKTALYRNDLLELPGKLGMWGAMIDHRLFPGTSPEQVQALVTSLQALAYRINALVDAREYPQAELLVRELKDDVRAWRLAIEGLFQSWAADPAFASGGDLQERLVAVLAKLESRIDTTFDKVEQGKLGAGDYENFYRLLGSYRGLSEAVVAHARLAEGIGWDQWREARF
jgi:uncharacterized membrane protein YccC